jgi:hypothetical protein
VAASQPRPEAEGEGEKTMVAEVEVECARVQGAEEVAGAGQGLAGSRRPA